MILFYVFGNGLGHLNRVLSYIKYYDIDSRKCIIITNSEYTDYLPKAIETITKPLYFFRDEKTIMHWLKGEITKRKNISELVIDVYPCGFYGELNQIDSLKIKKTLLARILKPHYFKKNTTKPIYDKLVVVEEGLDSSLYNTKETEWINLPLDFNYNTKKIDPVLPFFLIMHSGPISEVKKLYNLAKTHRINKEHIYIQTYSDLSDCLGSEKLVTLIYREKPYLELLDNAIKIFTGVGYNTFWSTRSYRNKQIMMPFVRGYDDQFLRKRISSF